jgi:MFS family permease
MRRDLLASWKGLPRSIYTLLAVQVVQSTGSFVQPFLALLLSQNLGFTPAQTGLFLTLNSLAMVPGNLWGGRLVDHWGRKKLLMTSRTLAAACLVPCALLSGNLALAFLLVASSVFASFGFSAPPAMVTDLTPAARRQDAFSLLYLGHNLGFALGTTVAGFLFAQARNWLFWGEALMVLLTVVLLALFVPETKPSAQTAAEAEGTEVAHEGGLWKALAERPRLLAFCGLMALVWLAYSQLWFGLPLYLSEVHGPQAGPPLYGLVMAFTAVVVLVITPLLSRLASGKSPALTIAVGTVFMGLGLFLVVGAAFPPLLFVAGIVLTVGEVLWATGAPTYIANHSPVTHRGRFNSVLNALQGVGSTTGPWLGGMASGAWGLVVLWPLGLAVNLLAGLGLLVLHRKERKL